MLLAQRKEQAGPLEIGHARSEAAGIAVRADLVASRCNVRDTFLAPARVVLPPNHGVLADEALAQADLQ